MNKMSKSIKYLKMKIALLKYGIFGTLLNHVRTPLLMIHIDIVWSAPKENLKNTVFTFLEYNGQMMLIAGYKTKAVEDQEQVIFSSSAQRSLDLSGHYQFALMSKHAYGW